MLKRKTLVPGLLCAGWLVLNWLRPELLIPGILCLALTVQILIQNFIEEKQWGFNKNKRRAGVAFFLGAMLTALVILLPRKIEAEQALLSNENTWSFCLAGTLCVTALF